jgi:transcriptional regulator with XRE-family HTH domain
MPLAELRRARGLSQEALAKVLGVKQSSVSKLERRTDMYISSLRSHIKAMGGELEIIARFPDGELKISDFSSIEPKTVT